MSAQISWKDFSINFSKYIDASRFDFTRFDKAVCPNLYSGSDVDELKIIEHISPSSFWQSATYEKLTKWYLSKQYHTEYLIYKRLLKHEVKSRALDLVFDADPALVQPNIMFSDRMNLLWELMQLASSLSQNYSEEGEALYKAKQAELLTTLAAAGVDPHLYFHGAPIKKDNGNIIGAALRSLRKLVVKILRKIRSLYVRDLRFQFVTTLRFHFKNSQDLEDADGSFFKCSNLIKNHSNIFNNGRQRDNSTFRVNFNYL